MGLESCPCCGEEHEPPRGAKCKMAKPRASRKVKQEQLDDDSDSGLQATGAGSQLDEQLESLFKTPSGEKRLANKKGGEQSSRVAVVHDEEEEELRRRLEMRACERRKAKLRAKLEKEGSSTSGEDGAKSVRKGREKKKKKRGTRKQTKKASPGSSPSDSSSSSSSSTSDSEGSRSRSRSRARRRRKKRSKFAIDRFTKGNKSMKRLTFYELLYAALVWGIKRAGKVEMDMSELQGYMGHLAYMCMHAITNNYSDEAYRGYDKAVREKVKEKGLKAFKMGDNELSLLHFNLDNAKALKEGRKASRPMKQAADSGGKVVRGSCYGHNFNKEGCTVKKCEFEHRCLACKSKEHILEMCPKKKY